MFTLISRRLDNADPLKTATDALPDSVVKRDETGGIDVNGLTATGATINGDLTVNGAATYINTTNLAIADKNITLNKGGAATSAGLSGLEFEENGSSTGAYMRIASTRDKVELKAPTGSTITLNQSLATTDAPTFSALTVSGNETVGGTLGVTGRTTTAGQTNSLGLNFTTATTKMIALTDLGTTTDLTLHTYDGIGMAANAVRYQAKSTGTDHQFYSATSSTASNLLMNVKGNGMVVIPKLLYMNNSIQRKVIDLFDSAPATASDTSAHNFHGFGIAGNTLIYQIPTATDSHKFYVATSTTTSNELFSIGGNGTIVTTGTFSSGAITSSGTVSGTNITTMTADIAADKATLAAATSSATANTVAKRGASGECSFATLTSSSVIAPSVTTTASQIFLQQSGDSMGSSVLSVRNRAGLNGCLVQQLNTANDLCDIGLYSHLNAQTATLRLEKRAIQLSSASNNTSGELQFRPDTTLTTLPFSVGYGQCTVAPACLLSTGAITASGAITLSGATAPQMDLFPNANNNPAYAQYNSQTTAGSSYRWLAGQGVPGVAAGMFGISAAGSGVAVGNHLAFAALGGLSTPYTFTATGAITSSSTVSGTNITTMAADILANTTAIGAATTAIGAATSSATANTVAKRGAAGECSFGALAATSSAISGNETVGGTLGVTGRTTTAGQTNSLGLNFTTANLKMLALTDAGTTTDLTLQNYDGFGISTNVVRYQAKATTTDHVFAAATSSSASTVLMTVKGNGVVVIPKVLNMNNSLQRKVIALYDLATPSDITGHQFYGFGVASGTFIYQVPTTGDSHKFYAGTAVSASNELLSINGNGTIVTTCPITCGAITSGAITCGAITSSGTFTSATGITATTGNISASSGNFFAQGDRADVYLCAWNGSMSSATGVLRMTRRNGIVYCRYVSSGATSAAPGGTDVITECVPLVAGSPISSSYFPATLEPIDISIMAYVGGSGNRPMRLTITPTGAKLTITPLSLEGFTAVSEIPNFSTCWSI